MAIPQPADPTLDAVDRAMEERAAREGPRDYLGMSVVGHPCRRKLWYDFHLVGRERFTASTLRKFEDGYRTEDLETERLQRVVELHAIDPVTGKQFGCSDHGGHFRGHLDGAVRGLVQAPETWHVWECKATNEANQKKLAKLKAEHGEKAALKEWEPTYYTQAQLYMHYTGMQRHYLTCASPGGRITISVRTDYNKADAEAAVARAKSIIESPVPLERLSEDPGWYQCKWCCHQDICHHGGWADVDCRTCARSTPELDGDGRWSCTIHPSATVVCESHVFNPALVPYDRVDACEEWVEYRLPNGKTMRNGKGHWASDEMPHTNPDLYHDETIDALRETFNARMVPDDQ